MHPACIIAAAVTLLCATPGAAQTVVDGSAAGVPDQILKDAIEAVVAKAADPLAAQFRKITRRPDGTVCGEVNLRTVFGGYSGFRSFSVVGPHKHDVTIVGIPRDDLACDLLFIAGCPAAECPHAR